jgi:hypothetical protein
MKNQLKEGELLVNRVKLLMGYDMSKTLNENTQHIFEQPDNRFWSPEEREILARGEEQLKQRQSQEESEKYPNWCKYPDKALGIPKNPEGAEGEDAIIVDKKTGKRFCYYPSPSNQKMGEINSVPIPEDSNIYFWDIQGINDVVNKLLKKYPKLDEELLISNLSKVFPIGSVRQFSIGNVDYVGYIILTKGTNLWKFGYYRNSETKQPYTPPKWIDKRSDNQKFIDEFGIWVQLGTAAVTLAAGFFTMGSTWGISNVLLLEIALELGVGIPVAFREFEKGKNVSASFSVITSLLPMLKANKYFRGISSKAFSEVSEKLLQSGLTKESTVRDYVKFYNGLSPEGQKIMSQLLNQDSITRDALWAEIKHGLDSEIPKIVKNGVKQLLTKHPNMLKDLKTFDKLWALDLRRNVGAMIGFGLLEIFLGDKLNDSEKLKIKQVYSKIPDSLKKELTYNLLNNQDKIGEITEHFQPNIDNQVKGYEKLMNTTIKYPFKKAGADYVELPDDKTIGDDLNVETINSKDLDIYRKKGWKPIDELTDDEYYDSPTMINNTMWVKVKKLNNGETNPIVTDIIK